MTKSILAGIFLSFSLSAAVAQTYTFDWLNTYYSDDYSTEGRRLATDNTNNVYVSGVFRDTVDFDPGAGVSVLTTGVGATCFLQKLDTDGNLIWVKAIRNGAYFDIKSMIVDAQANLIVAGQFTGTATFITASGTATISSGPSLDAFVLKLTPDGDFVWAKSFGNSEEEDNIFDMALDDAGNIYTTGMFFKTVDFDPGTGTTNLNSSGQSQDLFVQKLTADGDFVWAKKVGGSGFDESASIAIKDNALYVTGWFQNTADFDPTGASFLIACEGSSDAFLLSWTLDAGFNWAAGFGSIYTDKGVGVETDNDGNLYLTGSFGNTIDLDPGAGEVMFTTVSTNCFILKLNSLGEYLWAKKFEGDAYKNGTSMDLHPEGGVVVCGNFDGTVDFDPGTGVANLTSIGESDIFIVHLNAAGDYVWAGSFGNTGTWYNDYPWNVCVNNDGEVVTTGWATDTIDFDPGTGEHWYANPSVGSFAYVLKLDYNAAALNENTTDAFAVFPNPARSTVTIRQTDEVIEEGMLNVISTNGQVVLTQRLLQQESSVDISNLAPGMYIFEISTPQGKTQKLVCKE